MLILGQAASRNAARPQVSDGTQWLEPLPVPGRSRAGTQSLPPWYGMWVIFMLCWLMCQIPTLTTSVKMDWFLFLQTDWCLAWELHADPAVEVREGLLLWPAAVHRRWWELGLRSAYWPEVCRSARDGDLMRGSFTFRLFSFPLYFLRVHPWGPVTDPCSMEAGMRPVGLTVPASIRLCLQETHSLVSSPPSGFPLDIKYRWLILRVTSQFYSFFFCCQ